MSHCTEFSHIPDLGVQLEPGVPTTERIRRKMNMIRILLPRMKIVTGHGNWIC